MHMTLSATTYNNLLAFGATGVDNLRGGGWEKGFRGPAAVTMSGRTYHTTVDQSSSNLSSGVGYMFFDCPDMLGSVALDRNLQAGATVVREQLLEELYADLLKYNEVAQEVECVGKYFRDNADTLVAPRRLTPSINHSSKYFDIGLMKADNASGPRVIRFLPKGNSSSKHIGVGSCHLETFSYPFFFAHGEIGWGTDIKSGISLHEYIGQRLLQSDLELGVQSRVAAVEDDATNWSQVSR